MQKLYKYLKHNLQFIFIPVYSYIIFNNTYSSIYIYYDMFYDDLCYSLDEYSPFIISVIKYSYHSH